MDWSCKQPASVLLSQLMVACNRENPGQDSALWSQQQAFQTPPFTQDASQCNNDIHSVHPSHSDTSQCINDSHSPMHRLQTLITRLTSQRSDCFTDFSAQHAPTIEGVGGIKQWCNLSLSVCPSVRPSVCPMLLGQKRCILGAQLLWNANRTPHAGSQTH